MRPNLTSEFSFVDSLAQMPTEEGLRLVHRSLKWSVDWCLMALSSQTGYVVP